MSQRQTGKYGITNRKSQIENCKSQMALVSAVDHDSHLFAVELAKSFDQYQIAPAFHFEFDPAKPIVSPSRVSDIFTRTGNCKSSPCSLRSSVRKAIPFRTASRGRRITTGLSAPRRYTWPCCAASAKADPRPPTPDPETDVFNLSPRGKSDNTQGRFAGLLRQSWPPIRHKVIGGTFGGGGSGKSQMQNRKPRRSAAVWQGKLKIANCVSSHFLF